MSDWMARVLGVAFFVSVLTTPALSQDNALNASPLGDWVVERQDDRCVMSRQFGDSSNPYHIAFTRIDPWDGGYNVDLTGPDSSNSSAPFTVEWLPGGRSSSFDRREMHLDAGGTNWVRFHYGPLDAATDSMSGEQLTAFFRDGGFERFRRQVQGLRISNYFSREVYLETGEIAAISDRLDACISEVFQFHGIAAEEIAREDYRVASANSSEIMPILTNRLPRIIRALQRPTMVNFLLYLDERAHPTSCRLSTLPYDAEYERRTCRSLLANARFRFKAGEAAQPTFFKFWFIHQPD